MKVGLISGTGPQGMGIALRWALAGRDIYIGSRTKEKAENACEELNEIIGKEKSYPLINENMLKECEIVLLTVPYEYAIRTVHTYLDLIKENTKIFVDVTVPMEWVKGKGMLPVRPEEGSGAQAIKKVIGEVPVIGAFKTQSAEELMNHTRPIDEDNFVCGPLEHRETIMKLSEEIPGLRSINCGPLREAGTIEPLVPFLININRRHKLPKGSGAGIKLTF